MASWEAIRIRRPWSPLVENRDEWGSLKWAILTINADAWGSRVRGGACRSKPGPAPSHRNRLQLPRSDFSNDQKREEPTKREYQFDTDTPLPYSCKGRSHAREIFHSAGKSAPLRMTPWGLAGVLSRAHPNRLGLRIQARTCVRLLQAIDHEQIRQHAQN